MAGLHIVKFCAGEMHYEAANLEAQTGVEQPGTFITKAV